MFGYPEIYLETKQFKDITYTFSYMIGFDYITLETKLISVNRPEFVTYLQACMHYVTTLPPIACIIIFLKILSTQFYLRLWSPQIKIFEYVFEKIFILIFGTHLNYLYLWS